ncbi:hypothetical protein K402DRAFT_391225 [Aulographum hederae CBS 113979]|uniref:Uncharacterized protein n=1 Tax=Aulographum hederae CBS 113979 TaxID=1176131 RepID=A0A6G1H7N1_9PEZI|nr:hypothetical protein K402DRAFT_391225 [Aulographum hederae CBS 113979]
MSIFAVLTCLLKLSTSLPSPTSASEPLTELRNANHLFNAVHSSMRQWGSSLDHNGMSFFLASVPAGTQFYHGTHQQAPINGMEWLAFEPEHAAVFARPRRPSGRRPDEPPGAGHPPGGENPPKGGPSGSTHERDTLPWIGETVSNYHKSDRADSQQPLMIQESERTPPHKNDDSREGYLHTYATSHDLSLLYIDGMSAAKSDKGTLDSQDAVLLDVNLTQHLHPGFWEYDRAAQLCDLAQNKWVGKIDGFLRMEMGFEIVLCNFTEHLILERASRTKDPHQNSFMMFGYYRAVANRFQGIGGARVNIDYDTFVSAYTDDDNLDLFDGSQSQLPRLLSASNSSIAEIRDRVTGMVLAHAPMSRYGQQGRRNWQAVADMVVERYSARLQHLVSGAFTNISSLADEIEVLLSPFIDYDSRNTSLEIHRCATQSLPSISSGSKALAERAILSVSTSICSTLSNSLAESNYDAAIAMIREVMQYLRWTTWKQCSGCGVDEVCFIPIWPTGRTRDWEHPECQTQIPRIELGDSYWGFGHL